MRCSGTKAEVAVFVNRVAGGMFMRAAYPSTIHGETQVEGSRCSKSHGHNT